MKKHLLGSVTLLILWATTSAQAGTGFFYDDIQYWVGSGQNRAALVIDWVEDSDTEPALVWGYRWDGAATGEDMLRAVVAADPRLFARLKDWGTARSVIGLGYDLNRNGGFGISDGTVFDPDGIAMTGTSDGATATDTADLYREGWLTGFWGYGVAVDGNPFDTGHWESPMEFGVSDRPLADGDWDGFVFETDWGFDSFPENPRAAEAVPEAASVVLLISGLLAVTLARARRRAHGICA